MRWASDCTIGRDSVPRGLDWISADSWSSLTFLLPSKAMRPITGFSTTTTTMRPPALLIRTSWNRPVSISALRPSSISAWVRRPPGPLNRDVGHGLGRSRRRRKHSRQWGGHRYGEHDQGGQQAPPHSHSKHHAQRALIILMPHRTPRSDRFPFVAQLVANLVTS